VDVIERVGPGGHYLTHEHTRRHFRSELWPPKLMDRQHRRSWEASGRKTMAERIRAQVLDTLTHHEPLPIPAAVEARLKEIIDQADARHKS
jgi:trimethylamine--corrinoid protein Co-methyltransferase